MGQEVISSAREAIERTDSFPNKGCLGLLVARQPGQAIRLWRVISGLASANPRFLFRISGSTPGGQRFGEPAGWKAGVTLRPFVWAGCGAFRFVAKNLQRLFGFQEAGELADAREMPHFPERFCLDLADTFAGDFKLFSNFFERAGVAIAQTKPEF